MASEKNITMKEFNGTDYDTLYPKTKIEQVIGSENYFTKNETLSSSTAGLFGLSGEQAVPESLFNHLYYIINGNDQTIYRWLRWKFTEKKTALPSSTEIGIYNTGYIIYYYSGSYSLNKNGVANLINPNKVELSRGDMPEKILGKNNYITSFREDNLDPTPYTVFYYFGPNASFHMYKKDKYDFVMRDFTDVYKVSFFKQSEILYTTDQNKYVESDIPDSEGWYYKKLDTINQSSPLTKYQLLTYHGTNTYGSNNPTSLVFAFTPKLLIISQHTVNSIAWLVNPSTVNSGLIGNTNQSLQTTWGDKTVSWYSTSSASNQFNGNNLIYDCIALG